MGVEHAAATQLDNNQLHSVIQFEIADQNKITEEQIGRKDYEARNRIRPDVYKDHMKEELTQYGEGRALGDKAEEELKNRQFYCKMKLFKDMKRFNKKKKTYDAITDI